MICKNCGLEIIPEGGVYVHAASGIVKERLMFCAQAQGVMSRTLFLGTIAQRAPGKEVLRRS